MLNVLERKIIQIGDSFGVTIPIDYLKNNELCAGAKVDVVLTEGVIAIIHEDYSPEVLVKQLKQAEDIIHERYKKKVIESFGKLTDEEREHLLNQLKRDGGVSENSVRDEIKPFVDTLPKKDSNDRLPLGKKEQKRKNLDTRGM